MQNDWIHIINQVCNDLLRSKGDVFLMFGLHVMTGLAAIRLALFGIECMLNSLDGRAGMDWGGLSQHIFVIGAAFAMLRGYNAPILGLGYSFPDLIMAGPMELARAIGDTSYKQLDDVFASIRAQNPPSTLLDINLAFSQWTLDISVMCVRAAMLVIMSYGFVAIAVTVLVGPIFIPFLLFEPMAFMFWGWFRAFLQYSFYPVIGAAFTHIYASMLLNLITKATTTELLLAFLPLLAMTIIGMLHAPALCSALFSGSAGDHQGMARTAIKALIRK